MSKYSISPNDTWTWTLAQQDDVFDILDLVEQNYQHEIAGILTPNRPRMSYHLQKAILQQTFEPHQGLLTVAKDKSTNRLMAWSWLERGKYTVYANEEMAVAEFVHVDLALSARVRITLCAQILEMWIKWCTALQIPVLCSTTIRDDQQTFIRLHEQQGFSVRGSFAYKRIL